MTESRSRRGRGERTRMAVLAAAALAWAAWGVPAANALDNEEIYRQGQLIAGVQFGGGVQNHYVEEHDQSSSLSFVQLNPRIGYLPFAPFGPSWLRNQFEVGLEGWLQHYLRPVATNAGGLKLAFRHHFLGLGPFVPYVEFLAGAGGTNLQVVEIRSTFTFVLEGGVGLSYLIRPDIAVYAGYRFQHVSNGGLELPNRGVDSDGGTVGISFFLR